MVYRLHVGGTYDLKKQNNMKGVGQDYLRVVKIIHDNTNPIADTKKKLI